MTTPGVQTEDLEGKPGELRGLVNHQSLEEQIACACRILFSGGHGDFTLGHVSARGNGEEIFIKRSGLGLGEVRPEDVISADMKGAKLSGQGELHLETLLHIEVYKRRPDVNAIVHTHPLFGIAMGATDAKFEFISHDSVLFKDGVPIFQETAELIQDPVLGSAVAEALGKCKAILLRNHGVLVVGKDVPWAVVTAIALERAIQIQYLSSGLGPLCPMSFQMVEKIFPTKYTNDLISVYWDFMVRELVRTEMGDHLHLETTDGAA